LKMLTLILGQVYIIKMFIYNINVRTVKKFVCSGWIQI